MENLQHLLEQIKQDGVAKAEQEAARILQEAEQKKKEIIDSARAQADDIKASAQKEAADFEQRGVRALEQAARNVLIQLGDNIEQLFRACVMDKVSTAMDEKLLKEILLRMADQYFKSAFGKEELDVFLAEGDAAKLMGDLQTELQSRFDADTKTKVSTDNQILKGFRVSIKDHQFYHDFTETTVADELCRYLRPQLQEIVRSSVEGMSASA